MIRLELKDLQVGMISITEVQVALRIMRPPRFTSSSMGGEEGLAEVMAGLQRSERFLRRELRQNGFASIPCHSFISVRQVDRTGR